MIVCRWYYPSSGVTQICIYDVNEVDPVGCEECTTDGYWIVPGTVEA